MIDHTKPMQLDDGTPVRFLRLSCSEGRQSILADVRGSYRRRTESAPNRWGYWADTGEWCGAGGEPDYKRLQNVPVDPPATRRTRDGSTVRIIREDLAGGHPILGIITLDDGSERALQWRANGRRYELFENDRDLMPAEPEVETRYFAVKHDGRFEIGMPCVSLDSVNDSECGWGPARLKVVWQDGRPVSAEIV